MLLINGMYEDGISKSLQRQYGPVLGLQNLLEEHIYVGFCSINSVVYLAVM